MLPTVPQMLQWLANNDVKQGVLATVVGVNESSISRYKSSKQTPKKEIEEKIRAFYDKERSSRARATTTPPIPSDIWKYVCSRNERYDNDRSTRALEELRAALEVNPSGFATLHIVFGKLSAQADAHVFVINVGVQNDARRVGLMLISEDLTRLERKQAMHAEFNHFVDVLVSSERKDSESKQTTFHPGESKQTAFHQMLNRTKRNDHEE